MTGSSEPSSRYAPPRSAQGGGPRKPHPAPRIQSGAVNCPSGRYGSLSDRMIERHDRRESKWMIVGAPDPMRSWRSTFEGAQAIFPGDTAPRPGRSHLRPGRGGTGSRRIDLEVARGTVEGAGSMIEAPAPLATPASTMAIPCPVKASGMTSISRGRFLCWTSQWVPATT